MYTKRGARLTRRGERAVVALYVCQEIALLAARTVVVGGVVIGALVLLGLALDCGSTPRMCY